MRSKSFLSTFRSLSNRNFKIWSLGALVSNVGTWMQRTAQDWIVLTALTQENATAVGIVMGLQFGPQLLMLPITGFAADYFDRRKLLIATQAAMGLLALGLGVLCITGVVQLWHVYVFALCLGCVAAFDAPARQAFVSEIVGDDLLSNAVALNSTSFHAARMIGPALAGLLISGIGAGWVFILNALSYLAVILSLLKINPLALRVRETVTRTPSGLMEGFAYIRRRPDIFCVLVMFFLIGTFGINFPIFISTMSVTAFHLGAGQYGVLSSMMAIGSVAGALISARQDRPRFTLLIGGAAAFGLTLLASALAPSYWLFGATLVAVGISAQMFTTTANSSVQMWTDVTRRGRVMAIFMAVALGGTPLGAPVAGWMADTFGPRFAIAVCAMSGFMGMAVALMYLRKHRELKVWREGFRVRYSISNPVAQN